MIAAVIVTRNAGGMFPALLDGLQRQTLKPQPILVIDSGSADQTVETALRNGCTVEKIEPGQFDHGRTRNRAAETITQEFVVFLTQDAVPCGPDTLKKLVEPFAADPAIAAVYGRQLPAPGASPFARHLRAFNYPDGSHVRQFSDRDRYGLKTAFLSNSFAAYRTKDLRDVGYFQEGLIFGEDMFAACKLLAMGKKIAYCARAEVFHSHNYTLRQEFQRYFDMGVFHETEKWMLREFGRAEKDGFRYLKSELSYLTGQKQVHLFIPSCLRSFLKYAGYRAGRSHRLLPRWACRRIGLNHSWWDNR